MRPERIRVFVSALLASWTLALAAPGPGQKARAKAGPRAELTRSRGKPGNIHLLSSPQSLMVRVPAGEFLMGSTELEVLEAGRLCRLEPLGRDCELEQFLNEMPAHPKRVAAFWLDRTEVTVEAYGRCAEARACRPISHGAGAKRFDRPELPASLVSWHDARRYCAFRGARLPTETEFEYAARGSSRRQYPWGGLYHSHAANHGRLGLFAHDDSDGFVELAPVGSFPAGRTPLGVLDLAGNVAEWVEDIFAPYQIDTETRKAGTEHVLRGGHYGKARTWLRGAARDAAPADTRAPYIGFRCAKSAE